MLKRIICDTLLFTAVLLGPWWLTTIIFLIFIVLFKNYWEAFFAAIFMDSLYYIPSDKIWGSFGFFTLASLITIVFVEKFKKQIRI